jgi:hypothetical protein
MSSRAQQVFAVKRLIATNRKKILSLGVLPLLMLGSTPALAIQRHGGIEGLAAHQLGHLLFLTGLGIILINIHQRGLKGAGWPQFKAFLRLAILWNILTFAGHWAGEQVTQEQFTASDELAKGFQISSPGDILFYLSGLDNLILTPAILFFFLALRKWRSAA